MIHHPQISRRRLLSALSAFVLTSCSERSSTDHSFEGEVNRASADLFPNQPRSASSPASNPESVSAELNPLNFGSPPPLKPYDPIADDIDAQHLSRLYDHRALITQAGRSIFTAPRIRQSLEIHLSFVDYLADLPIVRRRDLAALESAARTSFGQNDLAKALEAVISLEEVKSLRTSFQFPFLHTFAVLLGTSVTVPPKVLLEAVHSTAKLSEWRRSALAWLTTATRSEHVERDIALRALPYVVSHLGMNPGKYLPDSKKLRARADGLAVARIHIATQDMNDVDVYAVIQNFQNTGASKAYDAFFQAYRRSSNSYLISFHDILSEQLSVR